MLFGISFFDLGAGFILLVAALIGAKKGMIKMLFGIISSVASLALAIFLVIPTTNFITTTTPIDDMLVQTIEAPLASKYPILDSQLLFYDHDANPDTEDALGFYYEETIHSFDDVLAQAHLTMAADYIKPIVIKFIPDEGGSALRVFSSTIVAYALIPICFLLIWVLAAIVFAIISGILKALIAKIVAINFIDRLAGFVIAFAVALVFIVLAVTAFDLLSSVEIIASLKTNFIDTSIIGGIINQYNPLTDIISGIDFSSIIDNILGSIGLG